MSWAFSVNVLGFFEKRPLQSRPYETPNFALERATPTKSPPGGKNLSICRKNKKGQNLVFFPARPSAWQEQNTRFWPFLFYRKYLCFFHPARKGTGFPNLEKLLTRCWKNVAKC